MGEEAGELDSFVRFLVMRLLNSLKGKALNYVRDGRDDSQVRLMPDEGVGCFPF
jgi:hypothetical protein